MKLIKRLAKGRILMLLTLLSVLWVSVMCLLSANAAFILPPFRDLVIVMTMSGKTWWVWWTILTRLNATGLKAFGMTM